MTCTNPEVAESFYWSLVIIKSPHYHYENLPSPPAGCDIWDVETEGCVSSWRVEAPVTGWSVSLGTPSISLPSHPDRISIS